MTASLQLLRAGIAASAGPPPLSARQVVTDWREYATNQRPAGWTYPHDQPTSTAIRVAGLSSAPGGRVLEWSTTGGSRDRYTAAFSGWSAYDGSAQAQDQEVYGEFEVVSPTYSNDGVHAFLCGLMARIGGTGSSERGFRLVLHQTIADGVKHLTLNAYTAGAYTELRTVPYVWEAGTGKVYAMRLKAEGPRLRGRVWERGTAEPAAWQIDYTLVDPTQIAYTGPPGLQFHEAAEVRCHRWGAGLSGESAPTDYPRPLAARTRQWFRSFGADVLGSVPAGFSQLFQGDGGRFRVVSDATAPGGRALEFTGQGGARGMYGLALDEVGTVGDVELYAELYVPASSVVPNCRFGGLIARAGASGSLWTGWGNDSRSDTGGILFAASNFDRWVGSAVSTTLTGDTGFTTTAGLLKDQWMCLRLKVVRNQFYARYWPRGTAEPSTWWRTTDASNLVPTSATATGRVGLYTQEDRTIRWGCIGVGVDGMPAPSAPSALPDLPTGAVLALESRDLDALASGTAVGDWPGLVGRASASTAPQKPTLRRSGLLPTVEFDGANNVLDPSLVLGSSLTIVYVSIPVADYGTLAQDGRGITRTAGGVGAYAYTGGSTPSNWRAKWGIQYGSDSVFVTSMTTLGVGQPYISGLAVDPAGYAMFHGRSVSASATKAEALGDTVLRIGSNNNHRLVALYAWPRRLSTAEYQQIYDRVTAWMAAYGIKLP